MVMVSMVMNAEEIPYTANDGTVYILDTETHCAHSIGCSENSTHIIIPKSITHDGANYTVTEIMGINGPSLLSIKIKALVTNLGIGCFGNSPSLKTIELPSSITSLGDMCFANCTALQTIEIPSSVTSLGYGCFGNCTALKSIEIPSSVTSLGGDCFRDCTSLLSIKIPSSVTSLGGMCFYGCTALQSIEIPSSVTSLGGDVFLSLFCSPINSYPSIPDIENKFGGLVLCRLFSYTVDQNTEICDKFG